MRKTSFLLSYFVIFSLFSVVPSFSNEGEIVGLKSANKLIKDTGPIIKRSILLDKKTRILSSKEGEVLLQNGFLQAEREGIVTNLASTDNSNCKDQESNKKKEEKEKFYVDIQIESYGINGFLSTSGIRNQYNDANFSDDAESSLSFLRLLLGDNMYDRPFDELLPHIDSHTSKFQNVSSQDVVDHYWRNKIVNADKSKRDDIYRDMGKRMSFEDQMRFIAKMGGAMWANYDYDRADQVLSADDIADCDDIISSLGTENPKGVCRDIVMCQAHILKKMGNENNVYGLSFAVPGNYHVTLVATDPKNPKAVHKIDYSANTIETERSGVDALTQDRRKDVGITYRLWKPNGKGGGEMVAAVPSQVGLILNSVVGGNIKKDFDPMIRKNYNLISIGGGKGPLHGRIFATQLSNGDTVFGVASHVSWGSGKKNRAKIFDGLDQSGNFGMAYARREFAGDQADDPGVNMFYLRFNQEVGAPINISENFQVRPYVAARIAATGVEGGKTGITWTGDGDVTLDGGVQFDYRTKDLKTRLHGNVYTQITPGLDDIRGLLGANPTLVSNHVGIDLGVDHQVSPDVRLNAGFLYVFREYGDSMFVNGGVGVKNPLGETAFNMGVLTPTEEDNQHAFMPGGSRTSLTTTLSHQIMGTSSKDPKVNLNVTYTQSLEDNYYQFNSGLGFKF